MYLSNLIFEALNYASLSTRNMLGQFYDVSGFSPVEIGFITACLPLIAMISNPFWFRMTSRLNERVSFIIISLSSSFLFWMLFLSKSFILSIISISLFSFFYSSCIPIGDSLMMSSVKKHGGSFDKIRLFGTIGFSATSLILSQLVKDGFIWYFIVASVTLFFSTMIIFFKKDTPKRFKSRKENPIIRNGNLFTFILMTVGFFFGVFMGSFHNTFIPILTREMGLDNSAIGIILALMSITEVPFLFFADKIIKKFGNIKIFILGLIATSVKTIIVTFAFNLVSILLMETLHGFTYILMYYSLFNYIHFKLPEKHLVRAQSAFWATSMGLSYIFSSVIGGFLVEWLQVKQSFRMVGSTGLLITLIVFLISFKFRKLTDL